jgi:hypothetical protein
MLIVADAFLPLGNNCIFHAGRSCSQLRHFPNMSSGSLKLQAVFIFLIVCEMVQSQVVNNCVVNAGLIIYVGHNSRGEEEQEEVTERP